ncbi:hypothetical protein VIGAN_05073100, partial [Vigna angularis var. angularis]
TILRFTEYVPPLCKRRDFKDALTMCLIPEVDLELEPNGLSFLFLFSLVSMTIELLQHPIGPTEGLQQLMSSHLTEFLLSLKA